MKKTLAYLAFTIAVVSFSANPSIGRNRMDSDSSLIIKLENDWTVALVKHDVKTFKALLAADFFYTENEKLYTRDEVMQGLLSTAETIKVAHNEEMQVHIKDRTAIVTGWLMVSGKGSGGDFNRKYRFTDIWYKKNGDWQLIGAQDYLLP